MGVTRCQTHEKLLVTDRIVTQLISVVGRKAVTGGCSGAAAAATALGGCWSPLGLVWTGGSSLGAGIKWRRREELWEVGVAVRGRRTDKQGACWTMHAFPRQQIKKRTPLNMK